MKPVVRTLIAGLGASLLLAACGGGGGGDAVEPITPPTALFSADKTEAQVGEVITLDASASTPANGTTLTYNWVLAVPDASEAKLTDIAAAITRFTPDRSGQYTVTLTVTDDKSSSTPLNQVITVTNPNPTAIVTPELFSSPGIIVQLDGTRSLPPDNEDAADLTFSWTLTPPSPDSTAVLDNPARSTPRFTPDVVGTYVAELVVTHGEYSSAPAKVQVVVEQGNSIPVANIATVTSPVRGEAIRLDGTGSSDADGDELQFRWRIRGPAADGWVTLDDPNSQTPSFTPQAAGQYTISLAVYDGKSRSAEKTYYLTVAKPDGAANTPPVAGIDTPWQATSELELGAPWSLGHSASTDIDGSYSSSAYTREWTLVSAPDGFDAAANTTFGTSGWDVSTFTPTHVGNYTFRLRVQEPDGAWSEPVERTFSVLTGANRPPTAAVAIVGGATNALVGSTVTLNGEGSSDPDGNRLTYAWEIVERPDGSSANLVPNAQNPARPTFVPDAPGPYIFSLRVTDEHGWPSSTAPARGTEFVLLAKTQNIPPVARLSLGSSSYTIEQPFLISEAIAGTFAWSSESHAIVQGSSFGTSVEAYDPDGDLLTYFWTLSSEPAGNNWRWPLPDTAGNQARCVNGDSQNGYTYSVTNWESFDAFQTYVLGLREWYCPGVLLSPSAAGAYTLEVLVSDGSDTVGPFSTTVPAVQRHAYPSLLLEHLNRNHTWSNNEQTLVLADYDNSLARQAGAARQVLFPFTGFVTGTSSYANAIIGSASLLKAAFNNGFRGDFVVRSFRLTAGGGDYKIINLKAEDSSGIAQPRFEGLTEGQVIPQGQSVDFQLIWPFNQLPATDENGNIIGGSSQKNFKWSFDVEGRPNLSFEFNPALSAY